MKQALMLILLIVGVSAAVNAQTTTPKAKPTKHHCTANCVNGKHMYAHGEKNHVCTEECKKMEEAKMALKDHVCTENCKDGKHMLVHGEKGHVCTEACKEKM